MKITELTEEQRNALPKYRDMYTGKLFGNNPPAVEKDVREYVEWFYQTFNVSENKKPEVFLLNSPRELLEKIAEVTGEPVKWYTPSYYLSAFNAWVAHFDFFDKECFKLEKSELFNQYKRVLDLNIFWSVCFENAVFVCRNAKEYHRDNMKKLHNIMGPAMVFPGGYSLYFIHGVALTEEIFKKLENKEYTFDDFVKEQSEEVKNAVMAFMTERWGPDYLFDFISANLKEVDTFTDRKDKKFLEGTTQGMNIGVYTLFKGNVSNTDLAFVRCYCPSSDRMFMLGCDPSQTNAKDAIASLYRVPEVVKDEIEYIQRQGERFFTVFTPKGKEILESVPKEDMANLVPISGERYFSLMRYEY